MTYKKKILGELFYSFLYCEKIEDSYIQPRKYPLQMLNILGWWTLLELQFWFLILKNYCTIQTNACCMSYSVYSIFSDLQVDKGLFVSLFRFHTVILIYIRQSWKKLAIGAVSNFTSAYNLSYIPKSRLSQTSGKISFFSVISNLHHAKSSHQFSVLDVIELSKDTCYESRKKAGGEQKWMWGEGKRINNICLKML